MQYKGSAAAETMMTKAAALPGQKPGMKSRAILVPILHKAHKPYLPFYFIPCLSKIKLSSASWYSFA